MIKSGEYPRTLFWGFADSTGYYRLETTKKLLAFLKTYPPRIILHHSNFDVLQLLLDGATVQILRSHDARLIRCKLGKHQLLNSYSVFPLSLEKIFTCFGYKKTSLDDLAKRNWEDCVNGLKCFLELDSIFLRVAKVSPLVKGTIAGTSFAAAQMVAGPLEVCTDYLEAYRGGRVEVFNTSEATCDKFDICSSYPRSILEATEKMELLKVEVQTEDFHCPLFDACETDSLLFPNGKFTSWVFRQNWEQYIEPHATKTKIKIRKRVKIDGSWLVRVAPLVRELYDLKSTTKNKAIEAATKLLLNSMYGRLGLKGERSRARMLEYFPDLDDATIYKLGRKRFLVFDHIFQEPKSNYPLAAFITDNARARLFRAFTGSNPYYGDTDSVFGPGAKKYFDSREKIGEACGEWKFEGTKKFKANNVKDYFWGEQEVLKGGKGFIEWTLKRLGSGRTPQAINREKVSELRKRTETESGITVPVRVQH